MFGDHDPRLFGPVIEQLTEYFAGTSMVLTCGDGIAGRMAYLTWGRVRPIHRSPSPGCAVAGCAGNW